MVIATKYTNANPGTDANVGQGKFFAAAGDAKISAVDVRDIASVAAAALTSEGTRKEPITSPARRH